MPTTAYAVTITPPVAGGFYVPVEVRFEHAAAPAAEPNPNPAYLVRDGSTPLQGRTLISDVTTFYFVATTAVLLSTWTGGDDQSKQSVTPAAYATPTAVALGPTSSGTPSADLSSRYVAQAMANTAEQTPVSAFSIQPFTSGRAPWQLAATSNPYAGVYDPMLALGYNVDAYLAGGTGGVSSEPALQMFFEANYRAVNWATSGQDESLMEWYVQYISPDHTSVTNFRPFMTSVGRNDNTDRWASTILDIGTDASTFRSQLYVQGEYQIARFTNSAVAFKATTHTLGDKSGSRTYATVAAGATNETSLKLGFGATTGALEIKTNAANQVRMSLNGGSELFGLFGNPAGGTAGAALSVGTIDNTAVGVFSVGTSSDSVKGVVIKAKSSQTGNLFEVQDSANTPRIKITKATASVAPSLVIGSAALATSATDGFVYLPTCAGTPTGVPTANTGTCAMVYDTTNNKIAVYNGAWKQTAALA